MAFKKNRGTNWGTELEVTLVEEVFSRYGILFGTFKGSHRGVEARSMAWQAVTDVLNGKTHQEEKRTKEQAEKKFKNLKSSAKAKHDSIRRPQTGGGPPPKPLTISEEMIIHLMEDRSMPSLSGIEPESTSSELTTIDIDSYILNRIISDVNEFPLQEPDIKDALTSEAVPEVSLLPSSSNTETCIEGTKRKRPKKVTMKDEELSLVVQENIKIKLSIKQMREEMKFNKKMRPKLLDFVDAKTKYYKLASAKLQ